MTITSFLFFVFAGLMALPGIGVLFTDNANAMSASVPLLFGSALLVALGLFFWDNKSN